MKLAAGYVRCSTEMQEGSIEQQKQELEQWASGNGYRIVAWFEDEGKSGTSFEKRPAFMRLVKTVTSYQLSVVSREQEFEAVVCYDESRWGRAVDAEENAYWRVHFRKHGVEVLLVRTSVDPAHEFAPMLKALEGVQASSYSKKLSELTMRGSMANARAGLSCGGFAPYGYRRKAIPSSELPVGSSKEKIEGRILRDGEQASMGEKVVWDTGDEFEVSIVRRIFEMKSKGLGFISIADALNREGIPCAKRGRWRSKDQKWSVGTIRSIITNEAYYGSRVYNKRTFSKVRNQKSEVRSEKRGWNPKSEWIVMEDVHPAIVSKELWERANAINRGTFAQGRKEIAHSPFLLSGLVRCKHCGFNFTGRSVRKGKSEIVTRYYQDSGFERKGESVCSSFLIRQQKIERFVMQTVQENLLKSNIEERLMEIVERKLKSAAATGASGAGKVERLLTLNKTKMDRLVKAIGDGAQSEAMVEEVRRLEAERLELMGSESRLKQLAGRGVEVRKEARAVVARLRTIPEDFERYGIEERKRVMREWVESIVIDQSANTAVCRMRRLPKLEGILPELLVKRVAGEGDAFDPHESELYYIAELIELR